MTSGMDGYYRPPESNLDRSSSGPSDFGSVERALRGDFHFSIEEVVSEAWQLVSGSKRVILGGLLVQSLVSAALGAIFEQVFGVGDDGVAIASQGLLGMLPTILTAPINAGIMIFAIKRSVADPSASFSDVFDQFDQFGRIAGVMLLQTLFIGIGFVLLILPGIYLAVAYGLALPLAAEKGMGVWESLETSRKALSHRWFQVFGLWLVIGFAGAIGAILTVGIGLIWIIPLATLSMGVLYRIVFGVESIRSRVEDASAPSRPEDFALPRYD